MKEILREIGMIERCFESISNIEFKEYDLARGQYLYLVRVCENPGIIQERVAEMLKVDKTTASRAIQKLVIAGLIEKRSESDNKKNLNLYPTEKGRQIHEFLVVEEEYSDTVALQGFTEQEIQTLYGLLRRMRENIQDDWELVKRGESRKWLKELDKDFK